MICPVCHHSESRVQDSRTTSDGLAIRRRRICSACDFRFSTLEQIELLGLIVIKRNGKREPYCREKLEHGLKRALEKRSYLQDDFKRLIITIESDLHKTKQSEITSETMGEIVLVRLKHFDKVAYIRFASVYRNFENLDTFYQELHYLDEL